MAPDVEPADVIGGIIAGNGDQIRRPIAASAQLLFRTRFDQQIGRAVTGLPRVAASSFLRVRYRPSLHPALHLEFPTPAPAPAVPTDRQPQGAGCSLGRESPR